MKPLTAAIMPMTHHITNDLARLCADNQQAKSTGHRYFCKCCGQAFTVPAPQKWPNVCPSCCPSAYEDKPVVFAPSPSPGAADEVSVKNNSSLGRGDGEPQHTKGLTALLLRVAVFQRAKFPGQTLAGKLNHLVKEAGELRDCQGMEREEWADVFILLLGALDLAGHTFDDLLHFAHAKMDLNDTRQWLPPDADGCYHHVK